MEEGRGRLKAEYKAVLRVTALMLCCAVLFLSGFYLGIYQGSPANALDQGTYTGSYAVSQGKVTPGPSQEANTTDQAAVETTAAPTTPTVPVPPTPEELLATLRWPVDGKISKELGWVYSDYLDQWIYLSGVDISCEKGSQVIAALDGTVRSVTVDQMLGTVVVIRHESGFESTYGRLSAVTKGIGEKVEQGDVIGTAGSQDVYFSLSCDGEALSARECLANAK